MKMKSIKNFSEKIVKFKNSRNIVLAKDFYSKVRRALSNDEKISAEFELDMVNKRIDKNEEKIKNQISKFEEAKDENMTYSNIYDDYKRNNEYDHKDIVKIIDSTEKDSIERSFVDQNQYNEYVKKLNKMARKIELLKKKRKRLIKRSRKILVTLKELENIKKSGNDTKDKVEINDDVENKASDVEVNNNFDAENIVDSKNSVSETDKGKDVIEVEAHEVSKDEDNKDEISAVTEAFSDKNEASNDENKENVSEIIDNLLEQKKELNDKLFNYLTIRKDQIDARLKEIFSKHNVDINSLLQIDVNKSLKVVTSKEERVSASQWEELKKGSNGYESPNKVGLDVNFNKPDDSINLEILKLLRERKEVVYRLKNIPHFSYNKETTAYENVKLDNEVRYRDPLRESTKEIIFGSVPTDDNSFDHITFREDVKKEEPKQDVKVDDSSKGEVKEPKVKESEDDILGQIEAIRKAERDANREEHEIYCEEHNMYENPYEHFKEQEEDENNNEYDEGENHFSM